MSEKITAAFTSVRPELPGMPADEVKFVTQFADMVKETEPDTQGIIFAGDLLTWLPKAFDGFSDFPRNFPDVHDHIRDVLVDGKQNDAIDELRPYTQLRINVIKAVAAALQRKVEALSSFDFLRDAKSRLMLNDVLHLLGVVYSDKFFGPAEYNMSAVERACNGNEDSGRIDVGDVLSTPQQIAEATLPRRKRKLPSGDPMRIAESAYGMVEGFFSAAGLKHDIFKKVLSYRGGELIEEDTRKPTTIIEAVRKGTRAIVFHSPFQDRPWALRIRDGFKISEALDGMGLFSNNGMPFARETDPHTLDAQGTSDLKSPKKIPLLVQDNSASDPLRLRAAKVSEIMAVTCPGGNTNNPYGRLIAANVPGVVAHVRAHAVIDDQGLAYAFTNDNVGLALKDEVRGPRVDEKIFFQWINDADLFAKRMQTGEKVKGGLNPLAPAGNPQLLCALFHVLACDVIERLYRKNDATTP